MEKINLSLTIDEVSGIVQVLGQLPTSSNVYPLLVNIKQQAEAQLEQKSQPVPDTVEIVTKE